MHLAVDTLSVSGWIGMRLELVLCFDSYIFISSSHYDCYTSLRQCCDGRVERCRLRSSEGHVHDGFSGQTSCCHICGNCWISVY